MRSVDLEGENTVSEESRKGAEENKSESVGKESNSWGLGAVLSQRDLYFLKRRYGLTEKVGARLAKGNEMARFPTKGFIGIFESQLKLGLRFPIFQLLQKVIDYYEVYIRQLFPLGICKMIAFEMAWKEAKLESSLRLFRHFYHKKRTRGFYYVCERSLDKDFLVKNKGPSAD